jgi:hypothetical protein
LLYCDGSLINKVVNPSTLYHEQCESHNKEMTVISAVGSGREKISAMHTLLETFCAKSADYLTPHKFS